MCRVIVVGAGASGTAAAHALVAAGHSVTLLEGNTVPGGRTQCITVDSCPVDIGASWIEDSGCNAQGEPNPMPALAVRYGISLEPKQGPRGYQAIDCESTRPMKLNDSARTSHMSLFYAVMRRVEEQVEKMADPSIPDCSVEEVYNRLVGGMKKKITHDRWMDFYRAGKEQYYGTDFRDMSLRYYGCCGSYGGRDIWVTGGYGRLIEAHLKAAVEGGCDLHLGAKVTAVVNEDDMVAVTALVNGEEKVFTADRVVVTIPIGVLKAKTVAFSPPLPPKQQEAISRLGLGMMDKLVLSFKDRFWGNLGAFELCTSRRGNWKWWTSPWFGEQGPHVLMCIIACDSARRAEEMTDDEVREEVLKLLAYAFQTTLPPLESFHFTRWGKSEWTRGSWSSIPCGSSPADMQALAEPLWGGRLLLAGEHTDPLDFCSVHGAYNSGLRAAQCINQSPRA